MWLTVFALFPDVVDNRFPKQVDTLLESLTPLLKIVEHVVGVIWKTGG